MDEKEEIERLEHIQKKKIEMELSRYLREHVRSIRGKQQMVVSAFAKALEIIPRQLSDNSGMDSTDVLNKLRQLHVKS